MSLSGSAGVEIANSGAGPAAGPFVLTLFEDRNANGAYDAGTDAVLGEEVVAGLDASATLVVAVPVAGSVTFAGNLVYAFVDSALAVAELDETNNYGSSSPACGAPRSPAGWNVGLEWAWTKPSVDPASNRVTSPARGDRPGRRRHAGARLRQRATSARSPTPARPACAP